MIGIRQVRTPGTHGTIGYPRTGVKRLTLSEDALVRALDQVGLRAPVRFDEVTPSTQATALEMAEAGAPEWTLVAAAHQTAGRGRLGRTWLDEPGRALMFSLVLRPGFTAEAAGLITIFAGAMMAEACRARAGEAVTCKWPNDLLLDDRKVGGVLAESKVTSDGRLEHVILGVGVNVGTPPKAIAHAGALAHADPQELLVAFLYRFRTLYGPQMPGVAERIVSAARAVSATLGTRVRARTVDGAVVEGEAVDLDAGGGLVVRTSGGNQVVRFGEVEHLE